MFSLNLCGAVSNVREASGRCPNFLPLSSSNHMIPARRKISYPQEFSVTIIYSGWAASSITLPDGRRQILSFLMPGDLVSAGFLSELMRGVQSKRSQR